MGGDDELVMDEVIELRGFNGGVEKHADAVVVRGVQSTCERRENAAAVRREYRPRYPGAQGAGGGATAAAVPVKPFSNCKWPLIIALLFWILPVILSPVVPCPMEGMPEGYARTPGSGLLALEEAFSARNGSAFVTRVRSMTDLAPASVPSPSTTTDADNTANAADVENAADTEHATTETETPQTTHEDSSKGEECRATGSEYDAWRRDTLLCCLLATAGWVGVSCIVGYLAFRGMKVLPAYSSPYLAGVACSAVAGTASVASFVLLGKMLPRYVNMLDDASFSTAQGQAEGFWLMFSATYYARVGFVSLALLSLVSLASQHAPPLKLYTNTLSAPCALLVLLVVFPGPATSKFFWLALSACACTLVPMINEYVVLRKKGMTREEAQGMM